MKKFIPIVFSHGLTGSRALYSTSAMELASNGFIVLALDHHDGSCAYTEDQNGKEYHFDTEGPRF